MAERPPPELARLLDPDTPVSTEAAWEAFLDRFSPLLLYAARQAAADYDGRMDRYRFILEQLRRNDFHRLRTYSADPRSSFENWLVVVANRLCTDFHRRRYGRERETHPEARPDALRERRRRLADLDAEELDPERTGNPEPISPARRVWREELSRALDIALEPLEPQDRLLIKLRFEDERPVREIAGIMGFRSVFQVYRRVRALRDELQERLRAHGIEEVHL